MDGVKFDGGKPRWDLLPLESVEEIVKVLTFGAQKYADDNWQQVPGKERRYFAAALRHLKDWQAGNKIDKDSGLPTLAHAACCLIFLIWNDQQKGQDENTDDFGFNGNDDLGSYRLPGPSSLRKDS